MADEEQVKFAKSIDFSRVDKADRVFVREIILKVVQFNDIMPPLTITIYPCPDHYNAIVKGWDQELDDKKWYDMFLNPETRTGSCDYVKATKTIPADDEGKAVKVLKIARFGKSGSNKKTK
jgi:hypothetical protein